MELFIKYNIEDLTLAITDALERKGYFIDNDELAGLILKLKDSDVFPHMMSVEQRVVPPPTPAAQPLYVPPTLIGGPDVVEEEHPRKPPVVELGPTALFASLGRSTRDLVQDEGEPLVDQMAKLLAENGELLSVEPKKGSPT